MKTTLLILTLSLPCLALLAAPPPLADAPPENPSAYTAMRLVGRQLGGDSLNRIVEIVGRDGVPQPFLWKIVVKGKEGGVQEIEVAGGKIANQRALVGSPAAGLPAIHLPDLNLDSTGAFEAADTQARRVRLRFDAVQYSLRAGETGKPLWTLDLLDHDGARVGGMRLAANDGATVSTEGRLAVNPLPAPAAGEPAEPPPAIIVDGDDAVGGFFTRTGRTLDRTNETVKRNLRKASSRVQRFFHLGGSDDSGLEPQN